VKNLTPQKIICIVALVALAVFATNTYRFRAFGRVVARQSVQVGSVPHRVVVRERCISSLDTYIILDRVLRSRNPEYEYWAELRTGGKLAAKTDPYHLDSFAFDRVSVASADSRAAVVLLDGDPEEFVWRYTP